jgi:hypothetical protein
MFPKILSNLHLFAPDPYDYVLSKLERNVSKDRDDAAYIFKKQELKSQILRDRYEQELRPNIANEDRHELTLKLWIEIFESP